MWNAMECLMETGTCLVYPMVRLWVGNLARSLVCEKGKAPVCAKHLVSLTEKVPARVDYLVFATGTALLRAKHWVRVTLKVLVNVAHLVRVS